MDRKPQRYGKRQHLGWKAYKVWTPIGKPLYSTEADAKLACDRHSGHQLEWQVSVRTPEGLPSWNGATDLESRSASDTYQASPHLVNQREVVPGGEFVTTDEGCNVYIQPEGEKWAVHTMVDLEGADPFWVMHITGGSSEQEGEDAAKLWNLFEYLTNEKADALAYGRYLWGRTLVRQNSPPPATAGKWRELIRRWAVRWL